MGNIRAPTRCCCGGERRIQEAAMTAQNRIRVEHGRKRVRILLAGELVADTTSPLLVWEIPYYPTYYVPANDVRAELVPYGSDADKRLGEAEVLAAKRTGGA